tara:strand:+ start:320 stop:499 length:180 start_codon:yes stop_codon:yes gene_type:complete
VVVQKIVEILHQVDLVVVEMVVQTHQLENLLLVLLILAVAEVVKEMLAMVKLEALVLFI